MGWSTSHWWTDRRDVVAELRNLAEGLTLVDESMNGCEYYQLIETPDGTRFIVCNLIRSYGGEYGYKTMDESMQPLYYKCPKRLINKATAPTSDRAKEWRQDVLKRHEKLSAWKKLYRQIEPRDTVIFRSGKGNDITECRVSVRYHWNKSKTQIVGYNQNMDLFRYPVNMMVNRWETMRIVKYGEES